ncbi:monocarboxylate transporter 9-like isoform X2 [Cylas formicarius]|uniref:monocarboxylate transporter 9-like isoform X2 n=1 Tax=Cylas formicarius TaxID=197179 RepID=UPI0029588D2E|nr:monocarboxylate transporter 9-like isoform X2 [Cylas formicarius]
MVLPKGNPHSHGHSENGHPRTFQGRESILASRISLYVEENDTKIPDGGWGWLVVLACTFINCVSDGITCTFGLLYIDFLNEFGASNSATAWIGSLYVAVPLVAGPIGSALVDRYGCKLMTVVGAVISTVGFILSTFAKNIVVMYVTFGFIGGIGLALCYVTAVVSIAFWFDKKRTLALGLAASGCGFGTVIYSPLITILSGQYGWRGTVLILAGLFANMIVCGLLMRDPDWVIKQEKERLAAERANKDPESRRGKKVSDVKYVLENVKTVVNINEKGRFHSVVNLPTYLHDQTEIPLEVLKNLSNDKHLYQIILVNYPNLLSSSSHSDTGPDRLAADASLVTTRVPVRLSMKLKPIQEPERQLTANHNGVDAPLIRRISSKAKIQSSQHLHHSYLKNIRPKTGSVGCNGAMLNIHKYKLTASSCPDFSKDEIDTPPKSEKWYDEFLGVLQDLTSFDLFADFHFFLLSIATIIMNTWFVVPHFYLADHMVKCKYEDYQVSLVISIIGGTNVLGMVRLHR